MGKISDWLFGNTAGGVAKGGVEGLMGGIGDLGIKLRSAITGEMSPDKRAELEKLADETDRLKSQGQMAINEAEAKSPSLFVAGWRPFIGWVCGVAIGWNLVMYPFVTWVMAIWLPTYALPPVLSLSQLWPVVLGMLGLGGLRSYEKRIGAQDQH